MAFTDLVVTIVQTFWGICEFIIFKKMKAEENVADKKSYKLLYFITISSISLGIAIGILLKFHNYLGLYNSSIMFPIMGVILIILGMVIRLSAISQLKKYFTVNVTIRNDHKLITIGLYKYIRHPAYSGGILSFIGCGLCYGNIISFIIIALPYFLLILNRIKYEEVVLIDKFGDDYLELMKKTKKLIPYIY
jgi:protein-S-isoprenylcysteine O-methyltransferase